MRCVYKWEILDNKYEKVEVVITLFKEVGYEKNESLIILHDDRIFL